MSPNVVELLYEALETELGLVVATSDPIALRAKLYAAMKADPELALFSIHQSRSNPNGEIIILRKAPDGEP